MQWMLPMFPVILSGTVGGILASTLEPAHAFPILICGLTFQGIHHIDKFLLLLTGILDANAYTQQG